MRRDITLAEVTRHAASHDGWMVLHGKVYNIAPYLMYHPGGSAILEKCLGKDGSKLFDKYHSWVNIENLIGPLLIGYLSKDEIKRSLDDNDEATTVGAKYLDGGNEDVVLPSKGVATSASSNQVEFDMPRARPAKGAEIPSLLGRPDDDETEDDIHILGKTIREHYQK